MAISAPTKTTKTTKIPTVKPAAAPITAKPAATKLQPAKPAAKPVAAKPVVAKAPMSGLKEKKTLPKFAAATLAATRAPVGKAAAETVATLSQLPNFTSPIPPTPVQPLAKMVTDMIEKNVSPTARYEEMASFGKANMQALIDANSVFMSGFQEWSKEVFSLTQESLEQAAATTSAMLGAKTLKDVVELNTGFAKANYEKILHNTTKLGEMGVKLATATAAPITARATHLVEKSVRPHS